MSEAELPRIDALDLRPDMGETLEIEWPWPIPPAVSLDTKQGDPHTFPGVSAGRPN